MSDMGKAAGFAFWGMALLAVVAGGGLLGLRFLIARWLS
jgi:hypothetical protein